MTSWPVRTIALAPSGRVVFDCHEGEWRAAVYLERDGREHRFAASSRESFSDALTRALTPGYPSELPGEKTRRLVRQVVLYASETAPNADTPPVGKSGGASRSRREVPAGSAQA